MKKAEVVSASGNFLVSERVDNWRHYNYENNRYLDALARILLVKSNENVVAAICNYNNKFYLSYNRTLTENNFNILENVINCVNSKNLRDLFIIHLRNNTLDFYKKIKAYLIVNKTLDKNIREQVDRFLKALENIEKDKTASDDNKLILASYTQYNKNDYNFVQDFLENPAENGLLQNYSVLINEIIKKYSIEHPDQRLSVINLASILLRPYQDILKVFSVLKDRIILNKNLIVLENELEFHAEKNINDKIHPTCGTYIGISRLSCIDCDKVLWDNLLLHRGTHGIYYKKIYEVLLDKISKMHDSVNNKGLQFIRGDAGTEEINLKIEIIKHLQAFKIRKDFFEHANAIRFEKETFKKKEPETVKIKEEFLKELEEQYSLGQQADLSDDEDIESKDIKISKLQETKEKLGIKTQDMILSQDMSNLEGDLNDFSDYI